MTARATSRNGAAGQRGHTLVEIAVAAAILGMIATGGLLAIQAAVDQATTSTVRANAIGGMDLAFHRIEDDVFSTSYNITSGRLFVALDPTEEPGQWRKSGTVLHLVTPLAVDTSRAADDVVDVVWGNPTRYYVADGVLLRECDFNPEDGDFDDPGEREELMRNAESVEFAWLDGGLKIRIVASIRDAQGTEIRFEAERTIRPQNED